MRIASPRNTNRKAASCWGFLTKYFHLNKTIPNNIWLAAEEICFLHFSILAKADHEGAPLLPGRVTLQEGQLKIRH